MTDILIRQFPCLQDNYGFLVHEPVSGETASIDTPDADRIQYEAEKAGWTITQIWNTHHHFDHAGGNLALKAATGARIIAPEYDAHRIEGIDVAVRDGDTVQLGEASAKVLHTPGHTTGHVVYWFEDQNTAFVGDTLFALGCGRLFEGTPADMFKSLSRLAAMPDKTTLYCAHEYTQANAKFALSIDPDNAALQRYSREVDARRARGEATVPTTLGKEKEANPFLLARTVDDFADARARKDRF